MLNIRWQPVKPGMRAECHPEKGLLLVRPGVPEDEAHRMLSDAIIALCEGTMPDGAIPLDQPGPYGVIDGGAGADTA